MKHHADGMSPAGIPDIIGVLNGTPLFIEVKAPGERPTRLQEYTLSEIGLAGGLAFSTDSLEEAKSVLGSV